MAETVWDQQYRAGVGLRVWPDEAALGFLGRRFGSEGGQGQRILDVGCGAGNNLLALAVEGFQGYGLDPSAPALERAAMRLDRFSGVPGFVPPILQQGSVLTMPAAWTGLFDAALDVRTLQHLVEPAERTAAYAELRRALRPGGWLGSVHLADRTNGYAMIFPAGPPVWLPDAPALVGLWMTAGFVVQALEVRARSYEGRGQAVYWVVDGQAVGEIRRTP